MITITYVMITYTYVMITVTYVMITCTYVMISITYILMIRHICDDNLHICDNIPSHIKQLLGKVESDIQVIVRGDVILDEAKPSPILCYRVQ